MFVFSEQHAFQGIENIQQILIFPNSIIKELFDKEMLNRRDLIKNLGGNIIKVSDFNAGAIYKLHARNEQSDINTYWSMSIVCGLVGETIFTSKVRFKSSKTALSSAKYHLLNQIIKSFKIKPLIGE